MTFREVRFPLLRAAHMFCYLMALALPAIAGEPLGGSFSVERDPWVDLQAAIDEARDTERRILLEVGGNWCTWCHVLDDFLAKDIAVRAYWSRHFVTIKVNTSAENRNDSFLGQYPDIEGYPHLIVLDSYGYFLHSQDTPSLQSGKAYSREAVMSLLKKWAVEKRELSNQSLKPTHFARGLALIR